MFYASCADIISNDWSFRETTLLDMRQVLKTADRVKWKAEYWKEDFAGKVKETIILCIRIEYCGKFT